VAITQPRSSARALGASERRALAVAALRSDRSLDDFASAHDLTPAALRRLIRAELAARLPHIDGALAGPVGRPVEIVRDRYGIPHVFAESEEDAYAGLGVVVAQDRLWQLEYRRRWAYGTLAELLGPVALATDVAARTLRFDRVAEAEHAEHPPETRRLLDAYADGINAAIAAFGDRLPIEFDVLGIRPAPWRAVDTVTIARASLWQFSGRIENIVIGEAAERLLPPELAARFLSVEAPNETILPPHPSPATLTPARSALTPALSQRERERGQALHLPAVRVGEGGRAREVEPQGSNQWAVGPGLSASGAPLLASDGHVPYYQPSTRYEVHPAGGDLDVVGIADVGAPLIHNGRTRGVAWGLTNNVSSNRDLYVEEPNPADPDEVRDGTGWARLETRQEEIRVRGAAPVRLTVRTGPRGPIVNHLIPSVEPRGDPPLALRWVGLDPRDCITGGLKLSRAQSCAEARETHRLWQFSGQNPGFADTAGHLGYQMRGRFPFRGRMTRGYRSPASPDDAWQEPIAFDQLPAETDPERGWIGSANQRPHPLDSDLPLYGAYGDGYRGRRIRTILGKGGPLRPPFSLGDMGAMHNDVYSGRAADLKGVLAGLLTGRPADEPADASPDRPSPMDAELARAARLLVRWDCRFTVGSVGASLFAVFWWRWCERVAAARFPEHLLGPMAGAAGAVAHDLLVEGDFGWLDSARAPFTPTLSQGERESGSPLPAGAGSGVREVREVLTVRSLARATMAEALAWLRERLGPDWRRWTWGRLHPLTLTHALSAGRPIFAALFDVGPRPCPGATGVLNQNSYVVRDRFWTTGGPHYRFLVDLAEPGQAHGVNTAGNSGNPASPHYADQFADWLAGRYHPLWMDRASIDANAEATLSLTPGPTAR
jgi:penicillin amidase